MRITPELRREAKFKVPIDLRKALSAASRAKSQWINLTPIARWDFISWIDSAKQRETRKNRIERACSMLAAGKRRPCCFSVVPMDFYKALAANPKAKAKLSGLTSLERRDFIGWITSAKVQEIRRSRIEKVCAMLSAGKRMKKELIK